MTFQAPQRIDIGQMRQRIRIQRSLGAQSPSGAQVIKWVDIPGGQVWASIQPDSGTELFQAQEIYPENPATIIIRYLPGVEAGMRVVWLDPRTKRDVHFNIKAVTDPEERHYQLVLTCVQRPKQRPT